MSRAPHGALLAAASGHPRFRMPLITRWPSLEAPAACVGTLLPPPPRLMARSSGLLALALALAAAAAAQASGPRGLRVLGAAGSGNGGGGAASAATATAAGAGVAASKPSFGIEDDRLMLDGKPMQVISGR